MSSPLITVILPVYNRENYLREAIQSILDQTYKNFELLIVDDASTDNSLRVAKDFQDPRIRIISNKVNKGVSFSRNKGIFEAKGDLIAFMDSDDISLSDRLWKQVRILEDKKDVSICGSWLTFMSTGKILRAREYHEEIKCNMLIFCSMSVGLVMARAEVFDDNWFDTTMRYGEDYELWSRLIWKERMYNIQESLIMYRDHKNQLSVQNKQHQIEMDLNIRLDLFGKINYDREKYPDDLLKKGLGYENNIDLKTYKIFYGWLGQLKNINRQQQVYGIKHFNTVINHIQEELVYKTFFLKHFTNLNKLSKFKILTSYDHKSVFRVARLKVKEKMKFLSK